MSHPLNRRHGWRRALLLFALAVSIVVGPVAAAHASAVLRIKTELGNIDVLLYTDRFPDTNIFTNIAQFQLFRRSGPLNTITPFLRSLEARQGRGMVFHSAGNKQLTSGLVELRNDQVKLLPQDARSLYESVFAYQRGTVAMVYDAVEVVVDEGNRTDPEDDVALPAVGVGGRWAIQLGAQPAFCPGVNEDGVPVNTRGIPLSDPPAPGETPQIFNCAAVFGRVLDGLDVADAIEALPRTHAFYALETPLFTGGANPLVGLGPDFSALPISTPLELPPGPNPFGCASVTEPPDAVVTNACPNGDALGAWLANRRSQLASQVRDRTILVEKTKFIPTLKGTESLGFKRPVEMVIAKLNNLASRAEWVFHLGRKTWRATDARGNGYSGSVEKRGDERFVLVFDDASMTAFLDTVTSEVEFGALDAMSQLLGSDFSRPVQNRRWPLVDDLIPGPQAVALLDYDRKPRLKASVDFARRTVTLRLKARVSGQLQTTVRMFTPGEVGARPKSVTRPIEMKLNYTMTGLLRGSNG